MTRWLRGTVLTLIACVASVRAAPASQSGDSCDSKALSSATQLVACIRSSELWQHMQAFEKIAAENPGLDGHPSRNSGEPGYKASVDYVAGLMRQAGYRVTIQPYYVPYFSVDGTPLFAEVAPVPQRYAVTKDWYLAFYSGSGNLTAAVQPAAGIQIPSTGGSTSGCSAADFANFQPGNIALIQRGSCLVGTKAANAKAAGAVAAIIFNEGDSAERMAPADLELSDLASFPVVTASYALGADLYRQYVSGSAPVLRLAAKTVFDPHRMDYNLIADSPWGDPHHVVVADAHLDAIFGAGMLDNASGSATILEIALKMAHTPTRNQLRFIWFGGEELGLLGSAYYTRTLPPAEAARIVFDIDADVTASPNYDILIADPAYASNAASFPPNVAPGSEIGNHYFSQFFAAHDATAYDGPLGGGNNGTDSNSFSLIGIPNTGVFTGQDCCKTQAAVNLWGGVLGNHEGHIPGFDGGCVDYEGRWCDNLDNADPYLFEFVSRAVAYVAYHLANASLATSVIHTPPATPTANGRPGMTQQ
jgi:hypothetical protein